MNLEEQKQAQLCAYALGELDAAERAELEAQLASSPELRAELEKLEATIGLVREFAPGDAKLSAPARAELERALPAGSMKPQAGRPWWRSPWMSAAAGLMVLLGASALLVQSRVGEMLAPETSMVARQLDAPALAVAMAPAADPGGVSWKAGLAQDSARAGQGFGRAAAPGDVTMRFVAADRMTAAKGVVPGLMAEEETQDLSREALSPASQEVDRMDACLRRPGEHPRDVFFRFWGDNAFEQAALDPLSTFAADVDTASYTLARRTLAEGLLPTREQVRTEEFINYFPADVAAPVGETLRIHTDLTPSRFGSGDGKARWMLRVVLRGREIAQVERKPLRLTFVMDCSGSMQQENRMQMVKDSLKLLLGQLEPGDAIGLVAFSTDAAQLLPMTAIAERARIEAAIDALQPDGWTNSEAGLRLGYETALAGFDPLATNRVIFLSDGVANRGITDPAELSRTVQPIREKGIFLNTFGVGMHNHNDALLEQLADKGDGQCHYIDDLREAQRVMVQRFMGTMETIARDVKIQVEFDPAQVSRYRLLGYENRALADADFRNDAVDAGEIGSGHQVSALYELESTHSPAGKPLAMVRVRWKEPRRLAASGDVPAREIAQPVTVTALQAFEVSPVGYRRAVIVAQFAEFLRRSVHAKGDSFDELVREAERIQREAATPEFQELVVLLERTRLLLQAQVLPCDELCEAMERLREIQVRIAELEVQGSNRDETLYAELQRRNAEQEALVRRILERENQAAPR